MTWFLINRYFLQARGRRNDRRYTSVFQCTVLCAHKAGTMVGYDEWGGTLRSNNFCHHQKFRLAKQIIAQCCMEKFNVFFEILLSLFTDSYQTRWKLLQLYAQCGFSRIINPAMIHQIHEVHGLCRYILWTRSIRFMSSIRFMRFMRSSGSMRWTMSTY